MRIIVELDGSVLDVEPAYWAAYSEALHAIGLARAERAKFWRLVRTAAPHGRIAAMTVGFILFASAAALTQPSGPAQEPQQASVALKHVESTDVVYTVHQGPYWGLGEVFGKVGTYMARHGQTGPMFGRYLDDPLEVQAAKLGTEVGFFVQGDIELEPDYLRKTLPAHDAATLVVQDPYGMSVAHHKVVLEWIAANGHTASGEVMEIYPPKSGRSSIIEIRIPIQHKSEAVAPAPWDTRPLSELVAAGAYQAVAESVIPSSGVQPPAHRRWLIDVVDRLRVVRKIVDKKYGRVASRVDKLVTPIVERAEVFRRVPPVPDGAGPNVLFTGGNIAKKKEVTLRELDRLMVRAHVKALDADEVFDQLVEILTKVRSIVAEWAEQGVRTPPTPRPAPGGINVDE